MDHIVDFYTSPNIQMASQAGLEQRKDEEVKELETEGQESEEEESNESETEVQTGGEEVGEVREDGERREGGRTKEEDESESERSGPDEEWTMTEVVKLTREATALSERRVPGSSGWCESAAATLMEEMLEAQTEVLKLCVAEEEAELTDWATEQWDLQGLRSETGAMEEALDAAESLLERLKKTEGELEAPEALLAAEVAAAEADPMGYLEKTLSSLVVELGTEEGKEAVPWTPPDLAAAEAAGRAKGEADLAAEWGDLLGDLSFWRLKAPTSENLEQAELAGLLAELVSDVATAEEKSKKSEVKFTIPTPLNRNQPPALKSGSLVAREEAMLEVTQADHSQQPNCQPHPRPSKSSRADEGMFLGPTPVSQGSKGCSFESTATSQQSLDGSWAPDVAVPRRLFDETIDLCSTFNSSQASANTSQSSASSHARNVVNVLIN